VTLKQRLLGGIYRHIGAARRKRKYGRRTEYMTMAVTRIRR